MRFAKYITELFKSDVGVAITPMRKKGSTPKFRTTWFLDVGGEKKAEYFFEAEYHNITALPNLPKGFYYVSFGILYAPEEFRDKVTDQFDLTGFGNATKVLSGVVDSFKKFLKRTNPDVFVFSAEEGKRVRLYDRFAKVLQKEYGYNYARTPSRMRDMKYDWTFMRKGI